MARELVQKYVDDQLYEFEQFTTTNSLKTLARLTKIVGEPLAIALGGFFKEEKPGLTPAGIPKPVAAPKGLLDRDIDGDAIKAAVAALVDRLDENEVVELVKKLTSEKVLCDHQAIVFDLHFAGRPLHLFKVLKAAIEAQYGNFFDAAKGIAIQPPPVAAVGVHR